MNDYDIYMEACRLMVLVQGQVNEKIAEKIDLDTTLKELAEISDKFGFHWEIKKI